VKRFLFVYIFLFFLVSSEIHSQTLERNSVFKCAEVFGDSITFLNDFTVNLSKRKTLDEPNGEEWDLYLMRGTVYRFSLCSYTKGIKIIMKLYNDTLTEKKPYFVITRPSHTKYFDYLCKKSDVYKVSVRFKNEKTLNRDLIAIGILGFIKKVKL